MPAAEIQLVNAVTDFLKNDSVLNVAVVSTVGHCKEDKAIVASFGTSAHVSVNHGLASISSLTDLDAIIINKILVAEQVVEGGLLDTLITSSLKALKNGGVAIIREDLASYKDGKKVAKLTDYIDVYRTEIDGQNTGFHFIAVTPVDDSVYAKQNWADVFWTLTKKEFPVTTGQNVTFRDFLDKTQYTDTGIFAYEWIFGDNFISPGGYDQNLAIIKRFGNIQAGQTMLDIGVGIGGGARQVASEFGVHVVGIDLSANMLSVALERNQRDKDTRVKYMITDILVYNFLENHFDYVFSRDCVQHIEDIPEVFARIYKCLKPGGKMMITMYGVGKGELSNKFKEYVAKRHYFLKDLDEIEKIAKKTGFTEIETENMTPRFKEILEEERSRVENNKEEFLSKFSQKEYDDLVVGWNNKLQYIADDNHNWNYILATKPLQ